MVVGKFVGLTCNSLSYLGPAVPDIDTVQAGKGVDIATSLRIFDTDALPARDDCWVTAFSSREILELGERM